ncbi:hypothetical protein [Burkholderia ubonensis]|uniref:hypothetical protein n=1 Tax=Burkholderia ubonensis TaxID=101571 RepID=UPI0018E04BC2|nr:hypothetical protein [Burkholderia ubonensis]
MSGSIDRWTLRHGVRLASRPYFWRGHSLARPKLMPVLSTIRLDRLALGQTVGHPLATLLHWDRQRREPLAA